jgi:hypothetical protein
MTEYAYQYYVVYTFTSNHNTWGTGYIIVTMELPITLNNIDRLYEIVQAEVHNAKLVITNWIPLWEEK